MCLEIRPTEDDPGAVSVLCHCCSRTGKHLLCLSLRLYVAHVSPVRAPENRKMNRSKNQCNTTTEDQRRVERVCQESKRTTTTTEPESDESLTSTVTPRLEYMYSTRTVRVYSSGTLPTALKFPKFDINH